VESNGVMEIGRYIDFHSTDGDTSDYGARLDYDGTNIVSTNAFSMASGIYLGGTGAANLLHEIPGLVHKVKDDRRGNRLADVVCYRH
jgi:hypothetical protein